MKTQTNHLTRQIQHSKDLARAKEKREHLKQVRKYQKIGWGLVIVWLVWVGIEIVRSL